MSLEKSWKLGPSKHGEVTAALVCALVFVRGRGGDVEDRYRLSALLFGFAECRISPAGSKQAAPSGPGHGHSLALPSLVAQP